MLSPIPSFFSCHSQILSALLADFILCFSSSHVTQTHELCWCSKQNTASTQTVSVYQTVDSTRRSNAYWAADNTRVDNVHQIVDSTHVDCAYQTVDSWYMLG